MGTRFINHPPQHILQGGFLALPVGGNGDEAHEMEGFEYHYSYDAQACKTLLAAKRSKSFWRRYWRLFVFSAPYLAVPFGPWPAPRLRDVLHQVLFPSSLFVPLPTIASFWLLVA